MARYQKALDVWALDAEARKGLQAGQWVKAGHDGPKGRYLGQTRGGSDVVAWLDNMRGRKGYMQSLRIYAKES